MDNRKTDSGEVVAALRDVTVTFDGYVTRALAHVNLEIRRGEILGVLGAKDAGKSTLLQLLAGRLRPAEGAVKVFRRSPRWGAIRSRIGYVPGKSGLDRSRGFLSRIFRRKAGSSPAARGGAGLTQAMMGGRDLVILDEPFDGANPAETLELKSLIQELPARGKTVVLSGDSLTDAKDICNRLVILHDGMIRAAGSLEELLNAPGALRFLAPVLPADIAGRIGKILREELARGSVPHQPSIVPPEKPTEQPHVSPTPDEQLTHLTKPVESAPLPERSSRPESAIDHEKLQELTKSPEPDRSE